MLQGDTVAPQEPKLVQAVRAVNKDLLPTSVDPARPEEIYYFNCHLDPTTQKSVVLWDDILQAFVNAVQVRDKARIVPFLKGSDLRNLEPRRIAALPNTVLDVVVDGPSDTTKLASSLLPDSLRQEEETKPGTDVVVSQNAPATSIPTVRRNPVYGLENTAMDNYTHIDHPGFAPPRRGPQALLDDHSSTDRDLPVLPHVDSVNPPPQRAPQTTTTKVLEEMDLVQLGIRAGQGDTSAQITLGDIYREGRGVKQDYQAAMDWYLKVASQGDPRAQYNIGSLYDSGQGVSQDYSQAMDWYLKAANQGYARAQYSIGSLYDSGQGVSQDYSQAMDWYLKAANQGDALAQYNIGSLYDFGRGVFQNYPQAMKWYLKAAKQGNVPAQNNIGVLYDFGQGVSQDYSGAMYWYLKAANQGDALAQYNIGSLYDSGQGVTQDYSQAMDWYLKAAEQGQKNAQYNIAVLYENGRGVPQSYPNAIKWYQKAADQGDTDVKDRLEKLKSKLNSVKKGTNKRGFLKQLFK